MPVLSLALRAEMDLPPVREPDAPHQVVAQDDPALHATRGVPHGSAHLRITS